MANPIRLREPITPPAPGQGPQPSVDAVEPPDTAAQRLAAALRETRERTLTLVRHLPQQALTSVYSKLLSPLCWDLAHIAAFEDLWFSRAAAVAQLRPELMATYDADETPRAQRGELRLLGPDEAFTFLEQVRAKTLALLHAGRFDASVAELVIRHEQQHNETMLQALQIAHLPSPFAHAQTAPGGDPSGRSVSGTRLVLIDGGEAWIGAGPPPAFAYDNERPRHRVALQPFLIGSAPVSNADWQGFIADGGYRRREWWSAQGWRWLERERAQRPLHWVSDSEGWELGELRTLRPSAPVVHVSFWEAEAFAASQHARLPTEFEWELAATWDPAGERQRPLPWGDQPVSRRFANIDQVGGAPAPAGSFPDGDSASGLAAMIGDVWEWTSTPFHGYPGFIAHPYPEYSEQFFGDTYRVLRGGSWATRARVASASFRNWDLPQRRQIFSGLRIAKDPA